MRASTATAVAISEINSAYSSTLIFEPSMTVSTMPLEMILISPVLMLLITLFRALNIWFIIPLAVSCSVSQLAVSLYSNVAMV